MGTRERQAGIIFTFGFPRAPVVTRSNILRSRKLNKQQAGFTLIELVVVITIIGVLAALALPRFAALQADARIAKMQGAVGSMKGAAAMAHAILISRGYPADYSGNPSAPDINIEGVDAVYANGYPDNTVIAALAGIAGPDYVTATPSGTTASVQPDANHAACQVIYAEAAAGAQPTYDVSGLTVANCD